MSQFIVWRPADSVGPTFKEASEKLTANSDVAIKTTVTIAPLAPMAFVVEAGREAMKEVQKDLSDWIIKPF